MKNTGTLKVKTHADREIVLTRVCDAPRHLVFDAFTNLLKCWFGPHGWSLVVRDVKLKAGSLFRPVMCGPDGKDLGMRGVYRKLTPPARSAQGEFFDDLPGRIPAHHGVRRARRQDYDDRHRALSIEGS